MLGFASSGLPGPKGNRETFVWLAEGGRAGALDRAGIEAAVQRGGAVIRTAAVITHRRPEVTADALAALLTATARRPG